MKYNKAEIMKSAWEIRKTGGVTMGEAMKTAWGVAKIKVGLSPMDDKVQEYFRRLYQSANVPAFPVQARRRSRVKESPISGTSSPQLPDMKPIKPPTPEGGGKYSIRRPPAKVSDKRSVPTPAQVNVS